MEPQKGEIWLVNFDPTVGSEVSKKRPAIVMSSNVIGILPLRIIVPVTSWQEKFANNPWLIKIEKNLTNNLNNDSTADAFQVKSISNERFIKKIGSISDSLVNEIKMGIILCIG
ncbi:MAG TPA: type II toxin-antitoxin system PemK/MazF family toxin [Spirochaetota bacterium]|nr:type II toxin-antitoxin system PemK/MazF family toxin [Spirochaetota bacterium]